MPVKRIGPDGCEDTFDLDLDYILAKEADDPRYSIFGLMAGMDETPRMTPLVEMARIVGWDLRDFASRGYTLQEDLPEIVMECLREVGFTLPDQAESSSASDSPVSEDA